jgi:hypothetical protein
MDGMILNTYCRLPLQNWFTYLRAGTSCRFANSSRFTNLTRESVDGTVPWSALAGSPASPSPAATRRVVWQKPGLRPQPPFEPPSPFHLRPMPLSLTTMPRRPPSAGGGRHEAHALPIGNSFHTIGPTPNRQHQPWHVPEDRRPAEPQTMVVRCSCLPAHQQIQANIKAPCAATHSPARPASRRSPIIPR